MKRFLAASTTALLALVLAACGTQGAFPNTHYGESVRTVSGSLHGYTGEAAAVHAYDYYTRGDSFMKLLATGSIDAGGAFTLEFAESVDVSGEKFWFCYEDVDDESAVHGVEAANSIHVMMPSPYDGEQLVAAGQIVLTDATDLAAAGRFETGDGAAIWIYSAEDQRVDRICQDGRTVALDLKRGWNTVVVVFADATNARSVRTAVVPSDYRWVLVPEPVF